METKEMMYLLAQMLKLDINNEVNIYESTVKICAGNGQNFNLSIKKIS